MTSCSAQPFIFRDVIFACLILFLALAAQTSGVSTENRCSNEDYSTIENCLNVSSFSPAPSPGIDSMKDIGPMPIDTVFELPSPLPKWPPGNAISGNATFASGVIDLGGLKVAQVTNLSRIWSNADATFFEPARVPNGFFMLGSYAQPNNVQLYGWLLVGKDVTGNSSGGSLAKPTDYTLVWTSENNTGVVQDNPGYIWLPIPPAGYKPVGYLVTNSSQKPSTNSIRCVRSDFTDISETNEWIWGIDGVTVYSSRPKNRGTREAGVATGTFIVQTASNSTMSPSSLRNKNLNFSAMPNMAQVQALMQAYSPIFRFQSDEEFFPSSVPWFFESGSLLYTKGNESNPVGIDPTGSNLPQNGSNDGAYWLDLPTGDDDRGKVKSGTLQNFSAYIHLKPMFGGTFTDLAVWLFYPFNGAAKAKLGFLTISLGRIGEHVGDWEHVTLRISNFDGSLRSVYFSQHGGGAWVSAPGVRFAYEKNKPIVFVSLHGHAAYPGPGKNLQGGGDEVGILNDTDEDGLMIDAVLGWTIISYEFSDSTVVEPLWLNYTREWGPKIDFDLDEELKKVIRFLPGKLKSAVRNLVNGLPPEMLGEEGPLGPKWKDNWDGDEK